MRIPRPRLDVRDLEVVLALAETGSTVKAAHVLALTQSAVSRALRVAEDKVGAALFERLPRGLCPTETGQRLVAGAGDVLAQLLELEAAAVGAPPVRVNLVCECYTAYRWLPSALLRVQERLPRLSVRLVVEATSAPVDALVAGTVDVAFLTTSTVRRPLREETLFDDEVVFVVARSHPLAARPAITREDLLRHTWLVSTATPAAEVRWFLGRVFGRRSPRVTRIALPLTEAIVDAARAGMGVAILSEWIAAPYLEGGELVAKRLAAGPLRRPWRMAYRREVEPAARELSAALAGLAPTLVQRNRPSPKRMPPRVAGEA